MTILPWHYKDAIKSLSRAHSKSFLFGEPLIFTYYFECAKKGDRKFLHFKSADCLKALKKAKKKKITNKQLLIERKLTFKVANSVPFWMSHNFAVLSMLPVATMVLCGLNATHTFKNYILFSFAIKLIQRNFMLIV